MIGGRDQPQLVVEKWTQKHTFISIICDAIIKHTLAPRSFHIGTSVGSDPDSLHLILHFFNRALNTSRYPMWSPAQYFKRVCITSSSKGRTRSKTYSRASGGSMALRAVKRLVHSAEVWLNKRKRAKQDSRRCQSCSINNYALIMLDTYATKKDSYAKDESQVRRI